MKQTCNKVVEWNSRKSAKFELENLGSNSNFRVKLDKIFTFTFSKSQFSLL